MLCRRRKLEIIPIDISPNSFRLFKKQLCRFVEAEFYRFPKISLPASQFDTRTCSRINGFIWLAREDIGPVSCGGTSALKGGYAMELTE